MAYAQNKKTVYLYLFNESYFDIRNHKGSQIVNIDCEN